MNIDLDKIKTHLLGKATFVASMVKESGLTDLLNNELGSSLGRKPEIPYGILIEMMIVNLCDDHKPLSGLKNYYNEHLDLEGIFKFPIDREKLTDDRFGLALDHLYESNPKKIFAKLAAKLFEKYDIKITKINFDTTSKIMWGTYETAEGEESKVDITYGHSKDKRNDKKQVKMAIGSANGVVVDIDVLSGNASDKTYNYDKLGNIEEIIDNLNVSKEEFYYIADSAFFTSKNIKRAKDKDIKFITSVPDRLNISKKLKKKALKNFEKFDEVQIKTSNKTGIYQITDEIIEYNGSDLKFLVYHSGPTVKKKTKSINKKIEKENKKLQKIIRKYNSINYSCQKDAEKGKNRILNKELRDVKFHTLNLDILKIEKNKPGRPSKDPLKNEIIVEYKLEIKHKSDEKKKEEALKKSCLFILSTSDLNMTGEEILREYKTQDSVEKNFQLLKSPQFVNSLYLESTKRIEAFMYLMMITVMIKSVVQYVVRRELKKEKDYILGNENRKNYKPTFAVIYSVFHSVHTMTIDQEDGLIRRLTTPLSACVKKIIKALKLEPDIFID